MLILLFQLGKDRYALEANRVVEVVPLLSLTKIPQAPKGVAGMFVYRGRAVPAVDLCELTIGSPARERLSTRIIIIDYSAAEVRGARDQVSDPDPSHLTPGTSLVGLIVERATGMMRRDARDFVDVKVPAAVRGAKDQVSAEPDTSHLTPGTSLAPWLGPVLIDDRGVIQLLHAQKLLPENVRDLVFAPSVVVENLKC